MQEISTSDAHPSITRVSDAKETAFSFATRKKSSRISISSLISKVDEGPPTARLEPGRGRLSFIGYEGGKAHVARQKKIVKDIVGKHGGILVGKGPVSCTTRRSLIPPTSATSCSIEERSATSPRRPRRGRSCCRSIGM